MSDIILHSFVQNISQDSLNFQLASVPSFPPKMVRVDYSEGGGNARAGSVRPIAYLPNFSDPNLEGYRPGYSEADNSQVPEIPGALFPRPAKFGANKFQIREIRGE
jgi:hypothetical protein